MGNACPPAFSTSAAAENIVPPNLAFSSVDLATMTRFAPSPASRTAIALPMPRLAPVIKTVLFFNDILIQFKNEVRKSCIASLSYRSSSTVRAVFSTVAKTPSYPLALNKCEDYF
jgi:hypothetical protein